MSEQSYHRPNQQFDKTVLRPDLKPACSSASSSSALALEPVKDNSKHNLARLADQADGTIIMTLLDVVFLRYDKRLYPLLRPFLCCPDPPA